MTKKKGCSSCSVLFGMLAIGALLGFFIYFGLPLLSTKTPSFFPPTPGIHPDMDILWRDCAINSTGWAANCNALITNDPKLTVYREFGLTCGGRYENIWGLKNCSDLHEVVNKAPPDGVPVQAWQNQTIKTLCLEVNESYEWIDEELTLLEDDIHWLLLDRYYLAIVEDGCDAVLTVDAFGAPLSARYFPAGQRYTGADVRGRMSLAAAGFPKLTDPFHGRIEPPEKYSEYEHQQLYYTPQEAPFRKAARREILPILTDWFGPALEE